jgi:hypothetical protein
MALAIIAGLFVLLIGGLVVAVWFAVRARRQLEDLEEEFAESRGVPLNDGWDSGPWSAVDLADLRDEEPTDVSGPDLFATLTHSQESWNAAAEPEWNATTESEWPESWNAASDSSSDDTWNATWNAASGSNGSKPRSAPDAVPGSALEPAVDNAPVSSPSPFGWRTRADAPVIILVVGAGFLGTGMTGAASADRLRRMQEKINDSFSNPDVITLDTEPAPTRARARERETTRRDRVTAEPAPPRATTHDRDGETTRDDRGAVDNATWSRARRRSREPFEKILDENRTMNRPPRSNGDNGENGDRAKPPARPKPRTGPEPIAWRAPGGASPRR